MNVTACLVTRGNVDMGPVVRSLPAEWEVVIWDNSKRPEDMAVYGRYEAIVEANGDLIYVQDDDCIVSDPQAIVDTWDEMETLARIEQTDDSRSFLVANMPPAFRHDFYADHALVGFGAVFPPELPDRAFTRFLSHSSLPAGVFDRTCDMVFTALTPYVLVDVPKKDRSFASAPGRMWRQPTHVGERSAVLRSIREVRDVIEPLASRR